MASKVILQSLVAQPVRDAVRSRRGLRFFLPGFKLGKSSTSELVEIYMRMAEDSAAKGYLEMASCHLRCAQALDESQKSCAHGRSRQAHADNAYVQRIDLSP